MRRVEGADSRRMAITGRMVTLVKLFSRSLARPKVIILHIMPVLSRRQAVPSQTTCIVEGRDF